MRGMHYNKEFGGCNGRRMQHACDIRYAYKALVGRHEEKRQLERFRRRKEDNIKLDLREVACEDIAWIHRAHDMGQWWGVL
jgi:hypothetical protein